MAEIQIPTDVLQQLAKAYGTDLDRLSYFAGGNGGSDGILYHYETQGKSKLLKLMIIPATEPLGVERTMERIRFTHYLAGRGVPTIYPHPSANGDLIERLQAGDKTYIAYTMDQIIGSSFQDVRSDGLDNFFVQWGKTIGQLHACSREYDGPAPELKLNWQSEMEIFNNWCQDTQVRWKWQELKQQLEQFTPSRDVFGMIHNDPHPWNTMVANDRVLLLDFDVSTQHWFMTDVAIAIYHGLAWHAGGPEREQKGDGFAKRLLTHWLSGYQQHHELSREWLDRLELFMHYRRILLYIVYYPGLQKNPDALQHWRNRILSNAPMITP